jgi:hypothetical protein
MGYNLDVTFKKEHGAVASVVDLVAAIVSQGFPPV